MNNTMLPHHYISLLKSSLLNELYIENEVKLIHTFSMLLNNKALNINQYFHLINNSRELLDAVLQCKYEGNTPTLTQFFEDGTTRQAHELRNFLELSHTMIGKKRLENIQFCIETILADKIPGDLIETGIWRGGACIFMRGCLMAHGDTERTVWAADSFEGVPIPTLTEDQGFNISKDVLPILAVPMDEVKELFSRYGLLDANVKFLKGWFKDSLPKAPISQLALLRLDGDLYESTMDALVPLYDKVVSSGFIIIDDFYSCPPCKKAVEDFRNLRNISEPFVQIDDHSVYWRKN